MKLALLFTENVSLKTWHDTGLIERDSLLYRHLCNQGHEVYFVTYGDPDDAQYLPPSLPVHVLSKPHSMSNRSYGWRLPAIHRDTLRQVDVIKSHQIHGARYAYYTARCLRKPYVSRCGYIPSVFAAKGFDYGRRRLQIWIDELLAFRFADAVCIPSQAEMQYIHRRYHTRLKRTYVCPNWIDTTFFRPAPAAQVPRRICFVGRYEQQKDPLTLLEAVRDLDDIELLMIGGGTLKAEIEERVKLYGIRASILDRVPNEELPGYLQSSEMYVLPTLYEGGSPKTLLEAMACALPVVTTSGFGVDEALEDGIHGFKCPPKDVKAFHDAIVTLLNDPLEARAMGERGRQRILEYYAIERAVERELKLLAELTAHA